MDSMVSLTDESLAPPKRKATVIDKNQKLSQSRQAVEFLILGFCKSFDFETPMEAAHFLAEVPTKQPDGRVVTTSDYMECLQDIGNFQKINSFLSLLETNLTCLVQLLERENDISMYLGKQPKADLAVADLTESQSEANPATSPERPSPETASLNITMNLLTLGLSK